jgi:hypothetical protein
VDGGEVVVLCLAELQEARFSWLAFPYGQARGRIRLTSHITWAHGRQVGQ